MGDKDLGLQTVFVNDRATSRRLRRARLIVLDGPDEGKTFDMGKSRVTVGRARINDVTLSDGSISSTHFELIADESGVILKDLGSTNGTLLGGCRVREVVLAPGASFRVGNTTLMLEPGDEVVEIPLSSDEHFGGVLGRSVAMREIFAVLGKVAPSDLTCLIQGGTGTGKERVARAIHERSRRKGKPYVVLDCSSIPRDLMESYVFGHEKGAFTGAVSQRQGAFEQADGGTLFLDEIGELDVNLQPKLLRVLENREFKRVGGSKTVRTDCRVIAATNRGLRDMVNDGKFREDLYFRLSIVNVELPPLSHRRDDVILLADHFLREVTASRPELGELRLSADAIEALVGYPWPGNVRELKNVMVRAGNLAAGPSITVGDLHLHGYSATSKAPHDDAQREVTSAGEPTSDSEVDLDVEFKDAKQEVIERFELAYLSELIEAHDGNISRASRAAGITRYHLRELLKKYDLK